MLGLTLRDDLVEPVGDGCQIDCCGRGCRLVVIVGQLGLLGTEVIGSGLLGGPSATGDQALALSANRCRDACRGTPRVRVTWFQDRPRARARTTASRKYADLYERVGHVRTLGMAYAIAQWRLPRITVCSTRRKRGCHS